jgi:hypothetical protein
VKQLTLTQPWATLVAIGAKRIETRAWQTSYRGPLAIHAAAGLKGLGLGATEDDLDALCSREPFKTALAETVDITTLGDIEPQHIDGGRVPLPRGCIVAIADLVDVVPTVDPDYPLKWERVPPEPLALRLHESPQERAFGDYSPGRFAWLLDDVYHVRIPIRTRGFQALTNVDRTTARLLLQQREIARTPA